jgi:hypothetical protein
MNYKIDKDIPIPPYRHIDNILMAMEVGDSIFLSPDDIVAFGLRSEALGYKIFTCRDNMMSQDGYLFGGIRLWRVA